MDGWIERIGNARLEVVSKKSGALEKATERHLQLQ